MTYIFVFAGEFGFELFNWHAVIRKFSKTRKPEEKIICCSRSQVAPLYEFADKYVDISHLPALKSSVACEYHAIPLDEFERSGPKAVNSLETEQHEKNFLQEVRLALQAEHPELVNDRNIAFIPSFRRSTIRNFSFGADKQLTLGGQTQAGIYEDLCVENNSFSRILPAGNLFSSLSERIKFDLSKQFILVQHRRRDTPQGSTDKIDIAPILALLSDQLPVVLLSFATGRALDSYSDLAGYPNLHHLTISSFLEQSCLISLATHCVFFSEGDYGSHSYVPPFLGKDVSVVCPWGVYQNGTTPISFWNREVFKFGGQIESYVAEDVCRSRQSLTEFTKQFSADRAKIRGTDNFLTTGAGA